ncbi:MAG: toxin [Paraglaciecola sp.]|nr:toxin [Paraglaciecola sp.]
MKHINWNADKNQYLMNERGISFEDIVFSMQQGDLLDDLCHPNKDKYPNQRLFVVNVEDYVHLVPYVENEVEIFLKTIIPSRKATKKYQRGDV